jgi:hypothetical protein
MDIFQKTDHDSRSYVRILQVLKEQADALEEGQCQQILVDLFRDSCSSGLVYQATVWNVVNLATVETLQSLFNLPPATARSIAQLRDVHMRHDNRVVSWEGEPPVALVVANLPSQWSRLARQEAKESREKKQRHQSRMQQAKANSPTILS